MYIPLETILVTIAIAYVAGVITLPALAVGLLIRAVSDSLPE